MTFKIRFLSFLSSFYLRFVGATSRTIWVNRSIRDELEAAGQGFIYAFWHGRQVFLVYLHRDDDIHPLVSQSEDGELIALVCGFFGLKTVRGSTSRGGVEALGQLQKEIESGARVGITPDGPRGPLREVQQGVLYLAQKTGRPIIPVAYGARKKWVFKGWDEFIVPRPFNRITMVYGEPCWVRPGDSFEEKGRELQEALNGVTEEADRVSGMEPCCKKDRQHRWVYRIFNGLVLLGLPLVVGYILVRWRRRVLSNGFRHWPERWGLLSPEQQAHLAGSPWWWVHAVSLGEVKAIHTFLRQAPQAVGVRILLSVVTPEALGWARSHQVADEILAAPIDLPWVVRRVFHRVRPQMFIFVESEFWPNLLREARCSGAQVALINGRISQHSFESYRKIRAILGALWENVDLFAVRQKQDAQRFAELGVDPQKIRVTGNLKYDLGFSTATSQGKESEKLEAVVVMGSTREGEETQLLPVLERLRAQYPQLRVIWAPRHLERVPELEALLVSRGLSYEKKSWMARNGHPFPGGPSYLLWDSMGDLLEAYQQADVAVIGGSFVPKGGQNPIEPAALKIPVLFGPWMDNFQGIAENLVEQGGAWQVSVDELETRLGDLLRDPEHRKQMGERASRAVEKEQGATERTLKLLTSLSRGSS